MIEENYLLKDQTFFRVGGTVKYYAEVKHKRDFLNLCLELEDIGPVPRYIIGACSNLVVSDSGFKGLVVKNSIDFIEYIDDKWHMGAGTLLSVAAKKMIEQGYAGMEKIGNIPGTIGGAIFGNVEANGQSISDYINEIEWCGCDGKCRLFTKIDGDFNYRTSRFKTEMSNEGMIMGARFLFKKGNTDELKKIFLDDKKRRLETYPKDPSCGCFFKNVKLTKAIRDKIAAVFGKNYISERNEGDYFSAGKLIDLCGLKGKTVGGAMVSNQHANFIINPGSASAQDIYDLHRIIKRTIKDKLGIEMENEVQFCGKFEDKEL